MCPEGHSILSRKSGETAFIPEQDTCWEGGHQAREGLLQCFSSTASDSTIERLIGEQLTEADRFTDGEFEVHRAGVACLSSHSVIQAVWRHDWQEISG